jgi:putative spermidine/putrescine transport system substrate-binding protein
VNNLYTIDSWVIMKGTPNKAEAEKYLVFVNDPQNQKNLPPKIPYGVTTKAATALIDKNVLPNLATAPENAKTALLINDKFWLENLDKLNQRFNAWVAK